MRKRQPRPPMVYTHAPVCRAAAAGGRGGAARAAVRGRRAREMWRRVQEGGRWDASAGGGWRAPRAGCASHPGELGARRPALPDNHGRSRLPPPPHPHPHAGGRGDGARAAGAGTGRRALGCAKRVMPPYPRTRRCRPAHPRHGRAGRASPSAARHRAHHGRVRPPRGASPIRTPAVAATDNGRRAAGATDGCRSSRPPRIPSARRRSRRRTTAGRLDGPRASG
jgi:hypothetical protein